MQTEKEQIQNQIQELQEKLKELEELSQTKSPVEEAFKDWWGQYPETGTWDGFDEKRWQGFQAGYEFAYAISTAKEVMEKVQEEPKDNEWKSVALRFGEELVSVGPCGYYNFTAGEWLEWTLNECKKEEQEVEPSMTNCVITGNPPNGYVTWQEWYNELGSKGILHNLRISSIEYEVREWDVVREIMNWCKEHPGQNPLDWVKPKTPEQVNPFVPKELEELVKEGVKQKDDYPYK